MHLVGGGARAAVQVGEQGPRPCQVPAGEDLVPAGPPQRVPDAERLLVRRRAARRPAGARRRRRLWGASARVVLWEGRRGPCRGGAPAAASGSGHAPVACPPRATQPRRRPRRPATCRRRPTGPPGPHAANRPGRPGAPCVCRPGTPGAPGRLRGSTERAWRCPACGSAARRARQVACPDGTPCPDGSVRSGSCPDVGPSRLDVVATEGPRPTGRQRHRGAFSAAPLVAGSTSPSGGPNGLERPRWTRRLSRR